MRKPPDGTISKDTPSSLNTPSIATAVERRTSTPACSSPVDRALRDTDALTELGLTPAEQRAGGADLGGKFTALFVHGSDVRHYGEFLASVVADHRPSAPMSSVVTG
jgi:hypothetical protein